MRQPPIRCVEFVELVTDWPRARSTERRCGARWRSTSTSARTWHASTSSRCARRASVAGHRRGSATGNCDAAPRRPSGRSVPLLNRAVSVRRATRTGIVAPRRSRDRNPRRNRARAARGHERGLRGLRHHSRQRPGWVASSSNTDIGGRVELVLHSGRERSERVQRGRSFDAAARHAHPGVARRARPRSGSAMHTPPPIAELPTGIRLPGQDATTGADDLVPRLDDLSFELDLPEVVSRPVGDIRRAAGMWIPNGRVGPSGTRARHRGRPDGERPLRAAVDAAAVLVEELVRLHLHRR